MTHPTCMTKSLEADTGEIAVPTWTLTILLKTVAEHMRGRPAADGIVGYIFGMAPNVLLARRRDLLGGKRIYANGSDRMAIAFDPVISVDWRSRRFTRGP